MKRFIISYLLVIACFVNALAQVDRSQVPEAGPAPVINIPTPETFTLKNGMKVFVVEDQRLPRVAFNLILNIDAIQEGEKAGYVGMAGDLLRNGTSTRSKAQIDEEVDYIGATLSTSATGIYAASLKKHSETLLELMTDVLYNPTFPEEEFEKNKKQLLSALAVNKDDPASIAGNVTSVLFYGSDHPYGELTTEETVNNISVEDCRNYYNQYFSPSIAYLAIVGDITVKEAKKITKKYFADWTAREVDIPVFSTSNAPEETRVALVNRSNSVQSEIRVGYPIALKKGHPDAQKLSVLNQILGGGSSGRLFKNIREDKGYTYGAYSSISSDPIVGYFRASMSVRNEVTDSALTETLYEMSRIVKAQVTEQELLAAKATMMGSFARSLESPQRIAGFALDVARYNMPADYYTNYLKKIEALTVADIQAIAERYITPENAWLIVVGKAADVGEKLKKFGPVEYYDIYGNEYVPEEATIPAGLTAEKVMQNFIEAMGGETALAAVKDMSLTWKGEMQGRALQIKVLKQNPVKIHTEFSMGGMTIMKQIYDGENVHMEQMGQAVPLTDEQKKDLDYEASMVNEVYVLENALPAKLTGIENIDGKNAYVVEVTIPSGNVETNYYSIETGLKMRSSQMVETPQGAMAQTSDILEYKEVDGLMFPSVVTIPLGPQSMKTTLQDIKLNSGIDESAFQVN
jgi:predicted Zn-dependent peptidase